MNEGPYDGTNWSTHAIITWLVSDATFVDTARNYAKLDETGTSLAAYLFSLLFNRRDLSPEEQRRITRDTAHTLDMVRDSLNQDGAEPHPRWAFRAANWPYICAVLLSE